MYAITYLKAARKALLKMPRNEAVRVRSKLEALATDPQAMANNVVSLAGRDGFRLRVGDWRIIFERNDDTLVILVIDIGPRGRIYR